VRDWDQAYRSGHNLDRQPSPLLVRSVAALKPGRALELACGAGRNAIYLASCGWQVTAIDLSTVAIEILRQRAAEVGVQVDAGVADLEAGGFPINPDSYDLILIFHFLWRELFPAVRRGIRAGGHFIGSIHIDDGSAEARTMNQAYLMQPGELRHQFRGWQILHYREGKSDEGHHHRLALADIVARKPRRKRN
jgi:tellurite methyltransferase